MKKATVVDIKAGCNNKKREEVKSLINAKGIEMIRLEFLDLNGVNRGKLLPVEMIDVVLDEGIAFAAAVMQLGFDNNVAEVKGLSECYDDMKVVGDPATFTVLPYLENTILLLGDLYYHGKPMLQSPRWFLKNMIKEYNDLGWNPISASEIEFFLFNRTETGEHEPYTDKAGNCYTSNVRVDPKGFLNKLTSNLKQMDFNVLYMNHEFYPGQYEYNWSHTHSLRSADEAMLFKGICKDLAEQHDMIATFMGKPQNDNGGSGCHFHISLSEIMTEKSVFFDKDDPEKLSLVLRRFVAGVLKHARSLTAFLAPTVNCFKRYRPDSFAPYHIGWGYDNRTTYVRIPEERGKGTRVEVRAGSAACNPYLAMAGILAAGLDGIKNQLEPPAIVTTDLYHDDNQQNNTVPKSLYRALIELEQDDWLCQCAGQDLINNFIAIKQMEVETFTNTVTDWEWENYSYHI